MSASGHRMQLNGSAHWAASEQLLVFRQHKGAGAAVPEAMASAKGRLVTYKSRKIDISQVCGGVAPLAVVARRLCGVFERNSKGTLYAGVSVDHGDTPVTVLPGSDGGIPRLAQPSSEVSHGSAGSWGIDAGPGR